MYSTPLFRNTQTNLVNINNTTYLWLTKSDVSSLHIRHFVLFLKSHFYVLSPLKICAIILLHIPFVTSNTWHFWFLWSKWQFLLISSESRTLSMRQCSLSIFVFVLRSDWGNQIRRKNLENMFWVPFIIKKPLMRRTDFPDSKRNGNVLKFTSTIIVLSLSIPSFFPPNFSLKCIFRAT